MNGGTDIKVEGLGDGYMITKNVYILVFNGMADWEPAIALCEIRRWGQLPVVSAGFSK